MFQVIKQPPFVHASGYVKHVGRRSHQVVEPTTSPMDPEATLQDEAREQVAKGLAAIEDEIGRFFQGFAAGKGGCYYSSRKCCWFFEDEFLKFGALVFACFCPILRFT